MTRPSVKRQDFIGRMPIWPSGRRRRRRPFAPSPSTTTGQRRPAPLHARRRARPHPGREGDHRLEGPLSYVTSAGSGPSVGKHILLCYLPTELAVEGTGLSVEYMSEQFPVTVAVAGSTPLFDPANERVRRSCGRPRLREARPDGRGRISLLPDAQQIDTRQLGFTISPHEECAVEEASGSWSATGNRDRARSRATRGREQLRNAVAVGAGAAVLLVTDKPAGDRWRRRRRSWRQSAGRRRRHRDLLRPAALRQRAADSGDYQVGVRVSHLLGLPCATGIKSLEVEAEGDRFAATGGAVVPGREGTFRFSLPAVVTVRRNQLPRYPSLPGRMRAKKAAVTTGEPHWRDGRLPHRDAAGARSRKAPGRGPRARA